MEQVKFSSLGLLKGLRAALVSVAHGDWRGELNGVHVDAERGYIVGIDGYRLSATKAAPEGVGTFTLANGDALKRLIAHLDVHGIVAVTAEVRAQDVIFRSDKWEVAVPRIDGDYPDYYTIMMRAKEPVAIGFLEPGKAVKYIKHLLPIARAANRDVVPLLVRVHGRVLSLVAKHLDEQLCYSRWSLGAEGEGEVWVNGDYIRDVLEWAKEDCDELRVVIRAGQTAPLEFSTEGPGPNTRHLIMPLVWKGETYAV